MVQYSEPLDEAGLGSAFIELRSITDNTVVPVDVSLDSSGYVLQIAPLGHDFHTVAFTSKEYVPFAQTMH